MKKINSTIILILIAILSCTSIPVTPPVNEVIISFTGDIIMHDAVKLSAYQHNIHGEDKKTSINNLGFDYLFEKISSYLTASDLVIGNMEFPVSPPFKGENMIFNCIPEIIPSMKKAGFTTMFLANNHILDNGIKGISDTINYLNYYSMSFIGVNSEEDLTRDGFIQNIHGIKVGLIGYVGYSNYRIPKVQKGYFINQIYNKEDVKKDIAKARANSDYLVLIVHSGLEYKIDPLKKDVDLIREYIEDGVDLVIRHHPHIVQPAEKIIARDGRECYVFYSLGNFISNQYFTFKSPRDGYIVHTKDSIIPTLFLKKLENRINARFEVLPITTINNIGKKREIQTVSIGDEIHSIRETKKNADEKLKSAIDKEIEFLSNKIIVLKKIIYRNQDIKEIKIIEYKHTMARIGDR